MFRVALICLLVACGEPALAPDAPLLDGASADSQRDAAGRPDAAPFDPYAGYFESPADLPRTRCEPGALAGFAVAGVWAFGFRTAVDAGELSTFVFSREGERLAPHTLTADDLFVRVNLGRSLTVIDVCAVAGTRIIGSIVSCNLVPSSGVVCSDVFEIDVAPITRLPGEGDGEHLSLVGEVGADWAQPASAVALRGTVAYVAARADGVRIVDVAGAPVERARVALPGDVTRDVAVTTGRDGRPYVITASASSTIIDVTNPSTPVVVADLPVEATRLTVDRGVAYFVNEETSIVEIWDVSYPRAPERTLRWAPAVEVGTFRFSSVTVADGLAYLTDRVAGQVVVIDVSIPGAVQVVAVEEIPNGDSLSMGALGTTSASQRVFLEGSFTDGLRIVDGNLGAASALDLLGTWKTRDESRVLDISTHADRAYLAYERDGVRVIDISDPTAPLPVGYFNTWRAEHGSAYLDGAQDLAVDVPRRRIVVADARRGLVVLAGDEVSFPLSSR